MVQQIASMKPDPAASSLPFDFNASVFSGASISRQTFNSELLRQSQKLEVYQQPRQPIVNPTQQIRETHTREQSTVSKNNTVASPQRQDKLDNQASHNSHSNERKESAFESAQIDKAQRNRDDKTSTSESSQHQHQSNANSSKELSDKQNSLNSETEQGRETQRQQDKNNTSPFASKPDNDTESSNEKVDVTHSQANLNAEPSENRMESEQSANEENFDYIDYVTTLVDYSESAKADATVSGSSNNIDASNLLDNTKDTIDEFSDLQRNNDQDFAALPDELANGSESILNLDSETNNKSQTNLNLDKEAAKIELASVEVESEFFSVSVNKEDLQAILDAKQIAMDLNGELSSEEIANLRTIIDDMLKQLSAEGNTQATSKEAALNEHEKSIALSDAELLQSLLLETDEELTLSQVSNSTQTSQDTAKQVLVNTQSSLAMDKTSKKTAQLDTKIDVNKSQSPEQAANVSATINNESESELGVQQDLRITNNQQSNKQHPVIDTDTQNKTALQNLSNLNEAQAKKALENISLRIQSIAAEVSEPTKANEFIAALQGSLQEFKQQIAAGREPGIDLKAMVNEALAQVNVDVASTKSPKIDASLGQFNAILNLASAVNHSSNNLQAQVLGATDIQLAKEINLSQIEGTKLANANSQLNAQATADKAVNIFKQEGQAQLAEKVRWMVNSKTSSAEIRLDPPDLGGINIKVHVSGDTAQVNFNVQSNAAKDALDQAAPRLREMLQEQGIELGQSSVQQDSQSGSGQDEHEHAQHAQISGTTDATDAEIETDSNNETQVIEQNINNGSLSGIDYYA